MIEKPKATATNLENVMSENQPAGTLFVVATPIGNLDDITLRAVDVLKAVGIVAAEDTRHSRVLLAHIGAAPARVLSLHDHNEGSRSAQLLELLQQGHDVALVSDAGTPLVSDPGFELVRLVRASGVRVVPIPGASAVMAALSASSLPVDRFYFEGFLPARATARRKRLVELASLPVSIVFFEAARRLRATLRELETIIEPTRQVLLAKELTKIHERIESGSISELLPRLDDGEFFEAGEFVCILGAPTTPPAADADSVATLMRVLCEELAPAQAARLAARITSRPRRELYEYALALQRR
jgi:16S rRNA (cytidine1402-2'-O)-methyltransferase